jgi:hypothetical protein
MILGIVILPIIYGFFFAAIAISYISFFSLCLVQEMDDKSNFEEYAQTLPVTRVQYVRGRYIELGIVFLFSTVLMLLAVLILYAFGSYGDEGASGLYVVGSFAFDHYDIFDTTFMDVFGMPLVACIFPAGLTILFSLVYPLVIKLGRPAGKIIMMVVLLVVPLCAAQVVIRLVDFVYGLIGVAEDLQIKGASGGEAAASAAYSFPHALGFALPVAAIAAFLISQAVSQRIIRHKDF